VCGAVSGGVLAIGLLYGPDRGEDEAAKAAVYLKAGEFIHQFAEVNGAVRCIDLIGMDVSSVEGVREYYRRNLKEGTCSGVVSSAVQVLLDLLEDWGK
jgi:C_GCAxxG_C_C family probable redox protein